MVVFRFMAEVKKILESVLPDALVTVQPHPRDLIVCIQVKWRKGDEVCEVSRLVTTEEIIRDQFNLASYYVDSILYKIELANTGQSTNVPIDLPQ